jgi:DNA primase
MLSGKELSRLVTIKDAETGKLQSRVVRTPVIVASVMSGTSQDLNPENASRCFLVNADESRIQTRRIHEQQRRKYSLEHLAQGSGAVEAIVKRHQAAQRMLTKRSVVNDFAPLLDFPSNLMRSRRDHDRFLDLIACVCYLRQYQKREEHLNGIGFIRCDLEDYRVAYRIMVEGVLSSTIRELPAGVIGLYEEIRAWVGREAVKLRLRPEEVSFTQRQVREMTGLSHTWVKLALRQLLDFDHLVIAKGGSERTKAFYRLRENEGIQVLDLSMIPTPEAMEGKLGGEKK